MGNTIASGKTSRGNSKRRQTSKKGKCMLLSTALNIPAGHGAVAQRGSEPDDVTQVRMCEIMAMDMQFHEVEVPPGMLSVWAIAPCTGNDAGLGHKPSMDEHDTWKPAFQQAFAYKKTPL